MWKPVFGARVCRSSILPLRFSSFYIGDPQIGPIGYEALLLGRGVIELVIRTAEYHRVLFTQCRFLRLDPESLIRIRLP